MKKIKCTLNPEEFIKVQGGGWAEEGYCSIELYAYSGKVILSPDKIRKLRKQLKRALIEIEGEKKEDDWFSVGRTVKIIVNTSGHVFPIGVNVRLVEGDSSESMRAEYLDGHDYWWVHKNDCEPAA